MVINNRRGDKPIPDNLNEVLNNLQVLALHKAEGFGWKLKFVRRPLFQEVVPVITDPSGEKVGVLEINGEINMHPDTKIRQQQH
jgi:outer membrane lipopolysaccharide assembly protein LptE/RlpB